MTEQEAGQNLVASDLGWTCRPRTSRADRFLTITGPGYARELFEQLDAEFASLPPDMGTVLAVAARNDVEVVLAGSRHQALPQPRPPGPPPAHQAGHRRGVHRPAQRSRAGGAVPGGGRPGRRGIDQDRALLLPRRRRPARCGRRRGRNPAIPDLPPLPRTPAELPDLVTAVYRFAEGQLPLPRALVRSSLGAQVRARRRAGRLETIKTMLEGIGQAQQILVQGCFGATPAREPVFRSGSGT
jgi:hypothetical protein